MRCGPGTGDRGSRCGEYHRKYGGSFARRSVFGASGIV